MAHAASRIASTLALALCLAGCGGDSGGSGTSAAGTVTIAAAPTPTPTVTPSPVSSPGGAAGSAGVRFPLGLTALADFPTLSWVFRPGMATPDPTERVDYRYTAARDEWSMRLPGGTLAALQIFATETGYDYTGAFFNSAGGHVLYTLAPGLQNPVLPLESTSVGYWGFSTYNGAAPGSTFGVLAYGVPTAAGDVPASGTGRYKLYGFTNSKTRAFQFLGTADVDFAAGSFAGDLGNQTVPQSVFPAILTDRFAFTGFSLSTDRASFTGRLTAPGLTGEATVEGQFTGPQARELMLRWKAPYRDPATGRVEMLYGTMAGRRS